MSIFMHYGLLFYRPSATAVLNHCYFWNMEKDHKFFEHVNDFIKSKEEHKNALEGTDAFIVIGVSWMEKVQQTEQRGLSCSFTKIANYVNTDLFDEKGYDGTLIRDLLRAFRETKVHVVYVSSLKLLFKKCF